MSTELLQQQIQEVIAAQGDALCVAAGHAAVEFVLSDAMDSFGIDLRRSPGRCRSLRYAKPTGDGWIGKATMTNETLAAIQDGSLHPVVAMWKKQIELSDVEPTDRSNLTTVLLLLRGEPVPLSKAGTGRPPRVVNYEGLRDEFDERDAETAPPEQPALFVGSSIMKQWTAVPEHMEPIPAINCAFGGSRTWEVLHYMDEAVVRYQPRLVCYYCGSNDVNAGAPAEEIIANITVFAERLRAALPGCAIVFCSIIRAPQKEKRWQVVDDANAAIEALATSLDCCEFVDLHPALELEPAGSRQPDQALYQKDGLHYVPEVYETCFAPAVRPAVERLWEQVTAGTATAAKL
jgi:lysophospholipase L1-like esterase